MGNLDLDLSPEQIKALELIGHLDALATLLALAVVHVDELVAAQEHVWEAIDQARAVVGSADA